MNKNTFTYVYQIRDQEGNGVAFVSLIDEVLYISDTENTIEIPVEVGGDLAEAIADAIWDNCEA